MTNNLTYPVLLNDTLNESLVGSSKIWWNDPPIAALIGVIGIVILAIWQSIGLQTFNITIL